MSTHCQEAQRVRFSFLILGTLIFGTFVLLGFARAEPPKKQNPVAKIAPAPADELTKLKREAQRLEGELTKVNRRIAKLSGRGDVASLETEPPQVALPAAAGLLSPNLKQMFADIQGEIDRLHKGGKKREAAKLAGQLRKHVNVLADPVRGADLKKAELHVIGFHVGAHSDGVKGGEKHPQRVAEVKVDYERQPIVLVLCAYNPIKWQIKLGKNANIQRVIVSGYHKQEVTGLPKDVPVDNQSGEDGKARFYVYRKQDYAHYARLVQRTRAMTGLEISTFQGGYEYKGTPALVGPDNLGWRRQLVESRLRPLHRAATLFERAKQRKEVQAIRFHALHFTATPRGHGMTRAWAEFSPTGPIVPTIQPAPGNVKHIAIDPKGPTYYGISGHGVVKVDIKTGKSTVMVIDGNLPRLSWPCGLAFDTKRRRLVLISLGGEGFMYSYTVDDGKWSLITSMNNRDLSALTYSSEDDMLYGMGQTHDRGLTALYCFSPKGGVVSQATIDKPINPGGHHFPGGGGGQLIAVGRQIVILGPPLPDFGTPGEPMVSRSYLINPRTGKVVFSGVMRPHAGLREFKADELAQLWKSLAVADDANDAETLMWQMAAGSDQTVEFLRKQIKPLPKPNATQIQQLISQLSDETFKTREAAFKALEDLGDLPGEQLKEAAKNDPSAEARFRASRLLTQIEKGTIHSAEIQRDVRATRVLGRIGTPAAVEYLKHLAAERASAIRAREAREALKRIEEQ